MKEEKFQALYKNTKKEEIVKELYYKCKANNELVYEIERLNNIINKALNYIDTWGYDEYELFRIDKNKPNCTTNEDVTTIVESLLDILKGIELTENDKNQIRWLREEFKVGIDKE